MALLKIDLTPYDQELYDPSGRIRRNLAMNKTEVLRYNAPCPLFLSLTPEDWLSEWKQRLHKAISGKSHFTYLEWNSTFESKYLPQGGHYPWSLLESELMKYYNNADSIRPKFQHVLRGRDYLLRFIRQWVQQNGYPQPKPFSGVANTYAGVPTGSKKGSFTAETVGMKNYRHVYPSVPGERILAGKNRVIFQDSVLNVRSIEQPLALIRDWARTVLPEFFGAWKNPTVNVSPTLTKAVMANSYFVESDYEGMDQHYTQDFFREIVLPLWCELLPLGERLRFQLDVEELFSQPLYMGNELWTGLHTLFSGQTITNDCETWGQVCQAIGILLSLSCDPHTTPQVHLGDDQTIAFKSKALAERYNEEFAIESEKNGLLLNLKKTRLVRGETQFCKKLYYPAGPKDRYGNLIGAYSSIRCLNSMIRPEDNAESLGVLAVSTWQRLDNCVGSPDWRLLVDMTLAKTELKVIPIKDEALARYASRDWWLRVYGETWDPTASPSYLYAIKQN